LGELCIDAGSVPGNWSGQVGVVQVIGQPPDGILYQCAGVKFTEGAKGSQLCVNGTGITLAAATSGFPISSDNVEFTGEQSSAGASGTASSSGSATTTSSASASATGKSAAEKVHVSGITFIGVLYVAFQLW